MGRARRKWTAGEDALLRRVVSAALSESRPLLWRELAKDIPGRSNKDCRRRWWNSLADGTAKGLWSGDEDSRLMQAVKEVGTNWRLVAQHVATRTPDQCSSHWTQVLDPEINHCNWTLPEDQQLLQEVVSQGTNWTAISAIHVPRRTTLALKNRYSTLRLKREKKRKKRRSLTAIQFEKGSLSGISKTESTAIPLSRSPCPGEKGEGVAPAGYDDCKIIVSEATTDDTDGMTSCSSIPASVVSNDVDMAMDWSGFLDARNGFCHTAVTDGAALTQFWKQDLDVSNYDQYQFPCMDPIMPIDTGADPFGLIRDPMVLYPEH